MINQLGILGLGSKSTLYYVEQLNTLYNRSFGGFSTCPFMMVNANFNDINPYLPDKTEQLVSNLKVYFDKIQQLRVSHLLIPNITLHETADKIIDVYTFQIIHPLRLLNKKLLDIKDDRVVLLGTTYTMQSQYIKRALNEKGIDIIGINEKQAALTEAVRLAVYKGEKADNLVYELIESFDIDTTFVIACTELSIALSAINNIRIFDLAALQIQNAVQILN